MKIVLNNEQNDKYSIIKQWQHSLCCEIHLALCDGITVLKFVNLLQALLSNENESIVLI